MHITKRKMESLEYTRDKSVGCSRSSILTIMTEYSGQIQDNTYL